MYLQVTFVVFVINIRNFIDAVAIKWHLPCTKNIDCQYAYICKEGFCREVREISEIMSKQKCPDLFKQRCTEDSECSCDEHQLVCRDFECNVPEKKPNTFGCKTHHDCRGAELCDNHRCREAVNFAELDMLLHFHSCSSNRRCMPGYECIDGNCMKIALQR